MQRVIQKLFGNRLALQLVEEEYKGLIVPASTAAKIYVLSRVVALGEQVTLDIKVGDIVFWQTNGIIQKQCRYDFNGVATFVLMAGDMIAKLSSAEVTRQVFQVIGDWCLVTRETIQPKRIIIPTEVAETNQEMTVKYNLDSKGAGVEMDIKPGDELVLDRSRANPIKLGKDSYWYIHKNFVLGVVV